MRLFPRFSLRFAWLALTVFLIVFATVAMYWRAYQAHEQVALQLQQHGNVEEEQITLLGMLIGKRLRGIELQPESQAALEVLAKLPRPDEVRRFGFNGIRHQKPEVLNQMTAALGTFHELEELHLSDLGLTEAQIEQLPNLPKLRVLELTSVRLPAGSLLFLAKMPNLETLILDETTCEALELLQLELPRLRQLFLNEPSLTYLELTKSKWGRFPLETLVIRRHELKSINAEAGALPRLKHLDLGCNEFPCAVDWKNLPAAMPGLTLLAVPTPWLKAEMIPTLAKFLRLRYLYVDVDQTPTPPPTTADGEPLPFESNLTLRLGRGQRIVLPPAFPPNSVQNFAPLDLAANPLAVPQHLQPAIKGLQAQRPELLFSADYSAVIQLLEELGLQHYVSPMWPSPDWRAKPGAATSGGFF